MRAAFVSERRKLSADEVHFIRLSSRSVRALARQLHVSHTAVWQARHGITYKIAAATHTMLADVSSEVGAPIAN